MGSPLSFLLQSFILGTSAVPSFALGGVTGNSFICWSLARVGRVVGITFIWDYQERIRFKDFVTVFMLEKVTHTISQKKMNAF